MKSKDQWRISDELWARVEPLLPVHVPKAHPLGCHKKRVPDRQVLDGIFFVLRTGIPWKALDATRICSGSTAHTRFQEWAQAGVFARLWEQALKDYDDAQGLDWSWLSMDGCMTKAPLGGKKTGRNPTDRGKLGAKRSLLCEAAGIPVGLAIEGANRHDMKLVAPTLESIPAAIAERRQVALAQGEQGLCMDKAYDYDQVRTLVEEFGFAAHIRARGEEKKALAQESGFRARRWVVERTHSWMNRFRRVLIRWEKKAENYLAMLHFACACITHKRFLFG